ncbi:MAG: hypothetical protein JWR26_1698 [Pedosphaera sp.]|nr:hypothetical protein [Pedosphaera sp.]
MRTKARSDSILHGLKPEQRERVDVWLFDENVSYQEVADRCRQMLEVKVPRTSVRRYYERECFNRKLEAVASPAGDLKRMAATLGKHTEAGYSIAVGAAGQLAVTEALKPEEHADVEKLAEVTRLMMAVRKEDNDRRRVELHGRKVALAEKRFQFDAAIECFNHEKEMKAIMAKKGLDDGDRVMEIRERLFGPNLPE